MNLIIFCLLGIVFTFIMKQKYNAVFFVLERHDYLCRIENKSKEDNFFFELEVEKFNDANVSVLWNRFQSDAYCFKVTFGKTFDIKLDKDVFYIKGQTKDKETVFVFRVSRLENGEYSITVDDVDGNEREVLLAQKELTQDLIVYVADSPKSFIHLEESYQYLRAIKIIQDTSKELHEYFKLGIAVIDRVDSILDMNYFPKEKLKDRRIDLEKVRNAIARIVYLFKNFEASLYVPSEIDNIFITPWTYLSEISNIAFNILIKIVNSLQLDLNLLKDNCSGMDTLNILFDNLYLLDLIRNKSLEKIKYNVACFGKSYHDIEEFVKSRSNYIDQTTELEKTKNCDVTGTTEFIGKNFLTLLNIFLVLSKDFDMPISHFIIMKNCSFNASFLEAAFDYSYKKLFYKSVLKALIGFKKDPTDFLILTQQEYFRNFYLEDFEKDLETIEKNLKLYLETEVKPQDIEIKDKIVEDLKNIEKAFLAFDSFLHLNKYPIFLGQLFPLKNKTQANKSRQGELSSSEEDEERERIESER